MISKREIAAWVAVSLAVLLVSFVVQQHQHNVQKDAAIVGTVASGNGSDSLTDRFKNDSHELADAVEKLELALHTWLTVTDGQPGQKMLVPQPEIPINSSAFNSLQQPTPSAIDSSQQPTPSAITSSQQPTPGAFDSSQQPTPGAFNSSQEPTEGPPQELPPILRALGARRLANDKWEIDAGAYGARNVSEASLKDSANVVFLAHRTDTSYDIAHFANWCAQTFGKNVTVAATLLWGWKASLGVDPQQFFGRCCRARWTLMKIGQLALAQPADEMMQHFAMLATKLCCDNVDYCIGPFNMLAKLPPGEPLLV